MKLNIMIVPAIFFVTCYNSMQAQDKLQFKVGYNTGMPVGAFKDFMGEEFIQRIHRRAELSYKGSYESRTGCFIQ